MCLISFTKEPSIATEDIECFKVLMSYKDGFRIKYATPCQYFPVKSTIIDGLDPLLAEPYYNSKTERIENTDMYYIHGGFIHSFETHEMAVDYCDYYQETHPNYEIFRCIIPKGTEYFHGSYYDSSGAKFCYAAKQIKFVEKISKKTRFYNMDGEYDYGFGMKKRHMYPLQTYIIK